jgi:hypothetical protein
VSPNWSGEGIIEERPKKGQMVKEGEETIAAFSSSELGQTLSSPPPGDGLIRPMDVGNSAEGI